MEILLACLMLLFGAATVVLTRNIYLSFAARDWDLIKATVVEVGSEERSDSDFQLRYHLLIRYTYTLHNKTYCGENYTFGKTLYTKKEIDRLLQSYSPDQEIDIRVNHRKPQQSVIVAGLDLLDFIFLGFTAFGCVILFRSLC